MIKRVLRFFLKGKRWLITVPVVLLALFFGWLTLDWRWYYARSLGSRTGVVQKISVKGSPVCKYVSGEMILQGTLPGQVSEKWEFTLDDTREDNPLLKRLKQAEREGTRVTVDYRQDLQKRWWWMGCTPSEYYVVNVE